MTRPTGKGRGGRRDYQPGRPRQFNSRTVAVSLRLSKPEAAWIDAQRQPGESRGECVRRLALRGDTTTK